jgi:hypothetical protein
MMILFFIIFTQNRRIDRLESFILHMKNNNIATIIENKNENRNENENENVRLNLIANKALDRGILTKEDKKQGVKFSNLLR